MTRLQPANDETCRPARPKKRRPRPWSDVSQADRERKYAWSRHLYKTPSGRAKALVHAYRKIDARKGLVCTLTWEWLLREIFSRPCSYCGGATGDPVGCDRVDNAGPHSPENVIAACGLCNRIRGNRFSHEEMLILGEAIAGIMASRCAAGGTEDPPQNVS